MDPVGVQALLMAGIFGIALAAISVMMIVNWSRAARGGLARNSYVGVRTPSTLRSEQSWVAGNRAAVRLAPLYLLFNVAMSAALVVVALHGWRLVVIFVGGGGRVVLIALSICTAVIAGRAARAADHHADDRSGLRSAASQSIEMPGITGPFSERATRIVGRIVAVAASAATAFLLITVIDGYVLAIHHQLQPNDTFGFRDATTRSCVPAWYAAQKAGFSWLLFGYGPFLALSILFAVVAVIKRRSPWDVVAVVMGTLFLLIFAVIIAGIHADSVARAIAC
jgi:SdpI/YfhL protein family